MSIWLLIMTVMLSAASTCYWGPTPYIYFGGKTLYDDVRGDIRQAPKLTGCEPVSLWLLARHGTRHPGEHNLRDMKNTIELRTDILRYHTEGRGRLWEKEMKELQEWVWDANIERAPYALSKQGCQELREFGHRINETYYQLLQRITTHYIRPTKEARTIDSARCFVNGLDFSLGYEILAPLDKHQDLMLMPYKNCDRHTKDSWNGEKRKLEMKRFSESAAYKKVLENVQKRVGLQEPLTTTNVSGLYDLCRFDRAFSENLTSPWCAIFSTEDLMTLEYMEDIKHYYRSGYGMPINRKLGRPVLADLLKKFKAVVADSKRSFTAFFSHDSLIDMVYSALGVFRDKEKITGATMNPNRRWRTSLITPFAANILVVLHSCTDVFDPAPFKVQFFSNERLLRVCNKSEVCNWPEFEEKLTPFLNSNLDFCKEYTSPTQ